ncbi:MAG: hypothetical protein JNL38_36350 [Myxococcales bacterium]|jgi:hypothetical protein|nr:hypothetical protein [Myxococcales bacterium]
MAAGGVGVLGAAFALAVAACDSFDSEPGGSAPDASTDAAVGPDASGSAEAGLDAGADGGDARPATIVCGADEKCVAGLEICCVWDRLGVIRRTACIEGSTCPERKDDAGDTLNAHAIECDDKTDCPAGLVCCQRGISACTSLSVAKAECVAPATCAPCSLDAGGNGRIGCDRQSLDPAECPAGRACVGTFPDLPYRFCE